MSLEHRSLDLITLFGQAFEAHYRTRLEGGADEPFYRAACSPDEPHRLFFRSDFYRSALHEVAHWCLAGARRRQLDDFGYWYQPEGRDAVQQQAFEAVEIKPQALEWAFCLAAGHTFSVSQDNLSAGGGDQYPFTLAVWQQLQYYCQHGFPPRAQLFLKCLMDFYGRPNWECPGCPSPQEPVDG